MNRRIFTAALSALLLTGVNAFAQSTTWTIDKNHSHSDFAVKHAMVSTVRGSLSGITGTLAWDDKDPTKSSVEVSIPSTSITTNNEARDKHLKSPDFFDVEKYPTLTFKSTSVKSVGGKLEVTGDLTMIGVTKSVTLTVDGPTAPVKGQGGKLVIGLSATGMVKRSDFNLGPKFGPTAIGDDVQFTIDAEAGRQP
jgi:polyisoprenoid-binding protein YceI